MYLFARRRRPSAAHTRAAMDFALEIGEYAAGVSGLDVEVWAEIYGPDSGVISWTTMVPDLKALDDAFAKLMVDDHYLAKVETADAMFTGDADDLLYQVLSGEPDPERRASIVTSVRGRFRSGKIAAGTALGVEIAQRASELTGHTTYFMTAMTGTYAGAGFLTGFDDVSEVEAANAKLAADAGWAEMVDARAGEVFAEDAVRGMYRRLS